MSDMKNKNKTMNIKNEISEIVNKEYEKHELLYIGFPHISSELTDSIFLNVEGVDAKDRRALVKHNLYRRINYTSHVEKQKQINFRSNFSNMVKAFLHRELMRFRKEGGLSSLDKDIGLGKNVSFFLSDMLFSDIYKIFKESNIKFDNPLMLKEFFVSIASNHFPLEFQTFLKQLKREDNEFWTIVYNLLIKLSTAVTNFSKVSSVYKDIEKDEVALESYEELKRIIKEDICFNDSEHFRSYSYQVCRNKMHEYERRNVMDDKKIKKEELEENMEAEKKLKEIYESDQNEDFDSLEINVDNRYELSRLAAIILLDSKHPLREQLIEDENKERIELLIEMSLDDLSYDEFIEEHYKNSDLSHEDKKRLNVNLRQDYSRIRKKIIKRLKTILESNEKMYLYKR